MRYERALIMFGFCVLLLPKFAFGQGNGVSTLITQPVDDTRLTVLKGNIHPSARPLFDFGRAVGDLPMERMLLVLRRNPEQEGTLRQLLDDQQTRTSANYHQWLNPEQFGKRFGP